MLALFQLTHGSLAAGELSPPPDWLEWQAKRNESIAGTNGWTTLIGRHWLSEGTNSTGTAATNQVVIRSVRVPDTLGSFVRSGHSVRFEAAPGVSATIDGRTVQTADLESDRGGKPTRLVIGPLTFVVIERGDRMGVRIRDPEASARRQFTGLHYFPYDPTWRIVGRFESFSTPRVLRVDDILGGTQDYVSPGEIVFQRKGGEYRLQVVEEPGEEDFFAIFRDSTANQTTYESGRFLYVARPDTQGRVTIDFNRAYTPPCGFTAFATCPLPPRQNWLPIPVRAGELRPGNHPGAE